MKRTIFYFFFILIIAGCSNEGGKLANKACSCLMEAGLSEGLKQSNFSSKFNSDNACTDKLGKELYEKMKGMNNSQRAEFMKDFAKGLLETDCAEIAFNLLPYDEWMNQMSKKYDLDYADAFKFFSNEPSICDCVKMYEKMSKEYRATSDENNMITIEKKYKERMDACVKLSEGKTFEEKRRMEEESENCR